jgi:hypothetical protein
MPDLYQLIADTIDQHHQADEYGLDTEDCRCGNDRDGTNTWAEHAGRVIGDMLIDLAGTGQLLASIDRIARKAST